MLIIALVLALVGLAALVAAVVTSNELIAWVCIGASVIGVLLLIADALRARRSGADDGTDHTDDEDAVVEAEQASDPVEDYPEDEGTVTQQEPDSAAESEPEIAGVTDADSATTEDADADSEDDGGVVDISPDPEAPPKS
ncbi:hypothetical protein ACTJJE_20905 [Mycolicibacterium sp. 22603]|uniref:hypothetical protein n=1 Tax=Mycolicibacterium sp. 22603 TaxID=3453950 RepID=UPI003F864596